MAKVKTVANLMLVIFVIAVLAVFAAACGNSSTSTAQTASPVQETEPEITSEQTEAAEPETMVEETEPAEEPAPEEVQESGECPSSTTVSVESTNGAYADRAPISWDLIGTQAATISNSTNNTGLFIYIANFETSENLKDVALSDGQAVLQFTVNVVGEGDPVPVSLGSYNVKEWVDNYASASIRLTGGTTLSVSTADTTIGEFEITSVTDTEVCGKFNIEEKWTKMSGEFKVPIMQ
ncbi:MAG: hypothetical protein PHN32_06610 [Actinomycetota bacterium]|nr:hypothetical protein [Actinomycetota bacterium]